MPEPQEIGAAAERASRVAHGGRYHNGWSCLPIATSNHDLALLDAVAWNKA